MSFDGKLLFVAGPIAFLANLLVSILAVKLHAKTEDSIHLFILNMAVADGLLTLLYPMIFYPYLGIHLPDDFRIIVYDFTHVCRYVLITSSAISLISLNVEKFFYFFKPLKYSRFITKRRIGLCILANWIFSIAIGMSWYVMTAIFVNKYYYRQSADSDNAIDWKSYVSPECESDAIPTVKVVDQIDSFDQSILTALNASAEMINETITINNLEDTKCFPVDTSPFASGADNQSSDVTQWLMHDRVKRQYFYPLYYTVTAIAPVATALMLSCYIVIVFQKDRSGEFLRQERRRERVWKVIRFVLATTVWTFFAMVPCRVLQILDKFYFFSHHTYPDSGVQRAYHILNTLFSALLCLNPVINPLLTITVHRQYYGILEKRVHGFLRSAGCSDCKLRRPENSYDMDAYKLSSEAERNQRVSARRMYSLEIE